MHQHCPPVRLRRRLLAAAALSAAAVATMPALADAALIYPTGGTAPRPTPSTLPTNAQIFEHIKHLTANGPRRIGTEADAKAAQYVSDQFRASGLTGVTTVDTPSYSWEALSHSLSVGGTAIDAFPSAYSQNALGTATGIRSTPEGGLNAPIVDVGTGGANAIKKQDVRGKIVVFDLKFELPTAALLLDTQYLYDPQDTLLTSPETLKQANPYITSYLSVLRAAQEGGAAGFVGVLADYFDSTSTSTSSTVVSRSRSPACGSRPPRGSACASSWPPSRASR